MNSLISILSTNEYIIQHSRFESQIGRRKSHQHQTATASASTSNFVIRHPRRQPVSYKTRIKITKYSLSLSLFAKKCRQLKTLETVKHETIQNKQTDRQMDKQATTKIPSTNVQRIFKVLVNSRYYEILIITNRSIFFLRQETRAIARKTVRCGIYQFPQSPQLFGTACPLASNLEWPVS